MNEWEELYLASDHNALLLIYGEAKKEMACRGAQRNEKWTVKGANWVFFRAGMEEKTWVGEQEKEVSSSNKNIVRKLVTVARERIVKSKSRNGRGRKN